MKTTKHFFQVISYLQYPFALIALYFVIKPYFNGFENLLGNYNDALVFAGIGISFSTLQDTTKTQNNFSKKVWESPKKGKAFIIMMAVTTFIFIAFGIYGSYISPETKISQLSFGILVFGIGNLGMLKAAIEMFENHRLDKNAPK